MSIANALFSESQSRLFRWLFGRPERAFHLSELRRLTGLGSASLQRELNRLVEAELVQSERVGNLRRFQASPKSPVYSELVSLTRKSVGMEPMLREALMPLLPRLKAAWIFGSVARQTDASQSEIDIMLIGQDLPLGDILERLLPMEAQLGRKINPTSYTPAEFEHLRAKRGSLVNCVLAQPILPLIGDTGEPGRAG